MSKLRWTGGRVVAVVVAGLFLVFGVNMMVDGNRRQREVEGWRTAKPVDGVVDFSEPGQFELPFTQTCSKSHGEVVSLLVALEVLQRKTVRLHLAEMRVELKITEKSGGRVVASAESGTLRIVDPINDKVPLFHFERFPKGEYVATVTVIQGAPALKGVDQRLVGRYLLCGLEDLPALISRVIGIGSLVVGVVVVGMVLWRVRVGRGGSHDEDAIPLG